MNIKDAQIRRLTIALNSLTKALDLHTYRAEWDKDLDSAFINATVVLSSVPRVEWRPCPFSADIDHVWGNDIGDVYQDGVWQPTLVAVLSASCVLSGDEPTEDNNLINDEGSEDE